MQFAKLGLTDPILKALADIGYTLPTAIQKQAIPSILAGKDIVAAAQTGTGKTASFVLPILEKFDLLLTDPPYGCGKADWDETFPTEWFRMAAEKCDTYGIITGSSGLKDSIALLGESFVDVLCGRNMNGMTRGPLIRPEFMWSRSVMLPSPGPPPERIVV